MPFKTQTLQAAVEDLDQVLQAQSSDEPREWVRRLDHTLWEVEQAGQSQGNPLEAFEGDGPTSGPEFSSATSQRRVACLQDWLTGVLLEAGALREDLRQVAAGLYHQGPLSAEFHNLRNRTSALIEAFRQYEQEEIRFLVESVNTDIGAGD